LVGILGNDLMAGQDYRVLEIAISQEVDLKYWYGCQRNGIQSRIGNPMIGRSTLQMSNSGDLRGERNGSGCLV
jgi:hypothetical protein